MKLLTKNQIQDSKNKERQLDIDQGLSFAKRIDVLRETKEKEEIALIKFREESKNYLKKDVDNLVNRKNILSEEIKTLKDVKKEALIPLDKKWEDINKRQENLSILEKSLTDVLIKSKADKKDLTEKRIQIDMNLRQSEAMIGESKRFKMEAMESENIAKINLSKITEQIKNISSEIESKSTEILQRQGAINAREYNAKIRSKNQDKREKELNEKERAINDKYETLLRNQKRLSLK